MSLQMDATPLSPVPTISISFAPVEEPLSEPYSPFSPMSTAFALAAEDAKDSYRPMLLSPPVQGFHLSPLRPNNAPKKGNGLGQEQFQMLLRTSKEKSAVPGAKKQDLRKEVALKAHKSKQMERRALFLSKIGAPPSPSAVSMPKTPPESPAVFHYSLPSPGLVSPLALFESLGLDDNESIEGRRVWVEQVDFRLAKKPVPATPRIEVHPPAICETPSSPQSPRRRGHNRQRSIPSLEQITQRYSANAEKHVAPVPQKVSARTPIPLPAFLATRRQSPLPLEDVKISALHPDMNAMGQKTRPRPPLPIGTGRLRFPVRLPPQSDSSSESESDENASSSTTKAVPISRPALSPLSFPNVSVTLQPPSPRQRTYALPSSPVSPVSPRVQPPALQLQITTTRIPHSSSTSPVKLTEANLLALNLDALSRERTARDMLCKVRRRTAVCGPSSKAPARPLSLSSAPEDCEVERMRRRNSSPGELPKKERIGFSHPVLQMPGGF